MCKLIALIIVVCVGVSNPFAEAVGPNDVDSFQVSDFKHIKITPVAMRVPPPAPPQSVAPVAKSDFLAGGVDFQVQNGVYKIKDYNQFFAKEISDHSIEGKEIEGLPFYTWNTWGLRSKGGFNAINTESDAQYRVKRLKPSIEILKTIFQNQPNAIIALQEFTQQGTTFRTDLLNALKSLNIKAEFKQTTGTQNFGQVVLYNSKLYKPVRAYNPTQQGYSSGVADVFNSEADPQQSDRVFKVYFEEQTGKRRQFAVVSVHLAFNSPNFNGLMSELITYSHGAQSPNVFGVIMGDFNYDMSGCQSSNPKVSVNQVGQSVVLGSRTAKKN